MQGYDTEQVDNGTNKQQQEGERDDDISKGDERVDKRARERDR